MANPTHRTARFDLRLRPEELAMLHELAEGEGLSAADIIRQLVRREHRERFGERRPSTKKPKK